MAQAEIRNSPQRLDDTWTTVCLPNPTPAGWRTGTTRPPSRRRLNQTASSLPQMTAWRPRIVGDRGRCRAASIGGRPIARRLRIITPSDRLPPIVGDRRSPSLASQGRHPAHSQPGVLPTTSKEGRAGSTLPSRVASAGALPGGGFGCLGRSGIAGVGRLRRTTKAAMEALDLTGGVDDALLAREEGVARRAQFHPDLRPRRAGRPRVTTGASDFRVVIVARVDVDFTLVTFRLFRLRLPGAVPLEAVGNGNAGAPTVPP